KWISPGLIDAVDGRWATCDAATFEQLYDGFRVAMRQALRIRIVRCYDPGFFAHHLEADIDLVLKLRGRKKAKNCMRMTVPPDKASARAPLPDLFPCHFLIKLLSARLNFFQVQLPKDFADERIDPEIRRRFYVGPDVVKDRDFFCRGLERNRAFRPRKLQNTRSHDLHRIFDTVDPRHSIFIYESGRHINRGRNSELVQNWSSHGKVIFKAIIESDRKRTLGKRLSVSADSDNIIH